MGLEARGLFGWVKEVLGGIMVMMVEGDLEVRVWLGDLGVLR